MLGDAEAVAATMQAAGVIPLLVQIISNTRLEALRMYATSLLGGLAHSSPERADAIVGARGP